MLSKSLLTSKHSKKLFGPVSRGSKRGLSSFWVAGVAAEETNLEEVVVLALDQEMLLLLLLSLFLLPIVVIAFY